MRKSLMMTAVLAVTLSQAADLRSAIEVPNASEIIKKDLTGPAKVYKMPAGCITDDADAVARGAYIFHNLNGSKAKGDAPKGLAKKLADGKPKQFGNCVACHNIEKAKGGGNIGPDLSNYHEFFIKTGTRDHQFVYQKIADPRIDNPKTHMTVNLTTGLFTEREICDIASYVVSIKK
ncbi:MAG: sulfur oxidation c-type cytochrome SoxX [Campylobacterales bacterium]|nr:sulfur oxidation c-type cytochrome SoxX [Campylobacterales bacterium]